MSELKPKTEEQKLVAFFRSEEGDELGRAGDYDGLSPAETAIRAMKERAAALAIAEAAEERVGFLERQLIRVKFACDRHDKLVDLAMRDDTAADLAEAKKRAG